MGSFVFAFRTEDGRIPNASEEAEWGAWFRTLGTSIADRGNRVGETRRLGEAGALGGYIVVDAENLDAAVKLAKGCPGLQHEGGIEVAEVVPSGPSS